MLGVFQKIQEICTKIGTRIFKIDQEMTEKIELKVGNPPKKKLINCIIKKRKIFGGGSNWPIFCCADFPCFLHNLVQKHQT